MELYEFGVCVFKIPKELFIKKSSKIRAITPLSRGVGGVLFFFANFKNKPKTINFVMKIVYI